MTPVLNTADNLMFLGSGGETGALIREHDWSTSTLGPPDSWPQSLRSVVGLLLNSKFPMFVAWGDDLGFLYNDAYIPVLGAKHPNAMGARFYDIWQEIWPDISPLIDAAMEGEAIYRHDLPLIMSRKGFDEQTWFTFSYSPVRDEQGDVAGMFCACTETTERMLMERRLRASEASARGVLDGMGEGFVLLDHDLRIIQVNEMALRLEQRARGEMIGLSYGEAWPGVEQTEQGRLCARVLAKGISGSVMAPYTWSDGRTGWFDVNAFPAADGVALFYRDITGSEESKAALAESEERLRLAVDNAEVGFWDVDVVNDKLIWPAMTKAMFGISADVPVTMHDFYEGLHPDDRANTSAAFAASADPTKRALYDVEYRTVGKEDRVVRWVAAKGRGVFDEAGSCVRVTGTAIEITSRKLVEQALHELNATLETRVAEAIAEREEAEAALRQSQKMEAIGHLTGGVAHDFNNLLTIIRSSTDLLRRRVLTDDKRRRYIDAISDTADRAAALTRQLLAFARRQPLQPEQFNLADRLDQTATILRSTLGSRLQLVFDVRCRECAVEADPNQFDTAILNMVVNARDAMNGEGELSIVIDASVEIPARRGHVAQAGNFATIAVADNGAGINIDQIDRIFEPFYTTKQVGMGTGLGLSQVIGFVKQSGGDVVVDSEPGAGSSFTLYLPRAADQVQTITPERDDAPVGPVEGGRCVLLVEDNQTVGEFAAQLLAELGYKTRWAGDAQTALELLARHPGDFDLVFSDVVMPGISGLDLAQQLRRERPGLPVILTSGYSHVIADEGTHGFMLLRKPYSVEELARAIRTAAKTAAKS